MLFINWPTVIPPQGKAYGVTPALAVSFLHVPPLSTMGNSTAGRAAMLRLRKVIETSEKEYFRTCGQAYPTIKWEGNADVLGEYFDYCRAVTLDRSIPDEIYLPKVGASKVDEAAAQVQLDLYSALKRGLLLPLFAN
ncbi:hypothetical protein H9P43_009054 [Blastocladiella emersonii ATCC 22665]|nr:hypothetical protein H9P43_009054 [Blastocladiella emersonii ATCC 22665]